MSDNQANPLFSSKHEQSLFFRNYHICLKCFILLIFFFLFCDTAIGRPYLLYDSLIDDGAIRVTSLQISPDSSTVVYRAYHVINNTYELYSVPIDGGTVTKLNGTLVPGGNVLNNYKISPDSSTVVYGADQDIDNVVELYSVSINGGTVTKLNSTLVTGGDVEYVYNLNP